MTHISLRFLMFLMESVITVPLGPSLVIEWNCSLFLEPASDRAPSLSIEMQDQYLLSNYHCFHRFVIMDYYLAISCLLNELNRMNHMLRHEPRKPHTSRYHNECLINLHRVG